MSKRLFSGIQPSGSLHLGNYLGAIKQWVELQDQYESIFCVVDLHAITVPQDPAILRQKILETTKIYLAAGVDPERSIIFVQSQISGVTQLAWILNTIATMGELRRMTQYKDKASGILSKLASTNDIDGMDGSIGVGLFDYPILMAADILLYDTALVPVGEDQKQHVELTRDLAKRFNKRFGETFVVPEPFIHKEGARIMGLDDPTKKMSKSAASEYNFIALLDEPDVVRKKIMKAVTDSGNEIVYSDEKPALKNLLNIYALLSNRTPDDIERDYVGKGYADFKRDLAEVVVGFLIPFQERFKALSDTEVLNILEAARQKVKTMAVAKMKQVYARMGLMDY